MEQNQLKEIAELIDSDIGSLALGSIVFEQEAKQYKLEASYDNQTNLTATHNQTINIDDHSTEQAINTVKFFKPKLTESSFNFFHSLDPFHNNVYLLISIDNCQQPIDKQKQDLIKENIKLKIDNYFINQQLALQELKYLAYLKEVKTIKEKLLPAAGHSIDGLDYATYYKPNIGGGGDYFDIMDLRDARRRAGYENPPLFWGVGLMDVSGHGPGAAVEVAMIDAILRTYQGKIGSGPGDVLTYLNKHFFTRQFRGGFGTCFLCSYDASSHILSYASAGHLPILVKHKEGSVSLIESDKGIPIGVEREHEWDTETTELNTGDTIIMFTDGITEAESKTGQQFGIDNLISCFEKSNAEDAKTLMADFESALNEHTNGTDKHDDQTLIILTISCC